jgi:hypothetical protein
LATFGDVTGRIRSASSVTAEDPPQAEPASLLMMQSEDDLRPSSGVANKFPKNS